MASAGAGSLTTLRIRRRSGGGGCARGGAGGVHLCRIQAGDFTAARRLLLLR